MGPSVLIIHIFSGFELTNISEGQRLYTLYNILKQIERIADCAHAKITTIKSKV